MTFAGCDVFFYRVKVLLLMMSTEMLLSAPFWVDCDGFLSVLSSISVFYILFYLFLYILTILDAWFLPLHKPGLNFCAAQSLKLGQVFTIRVVVRVSMVSFALLWLEMGLVLAHNCLGSGFGPGQILDTTLDSHVNRSLCFLSLRCKAGTVNNISACVSLHNMFV